MMRAESYSPGPGATLGPMLADIDKPGELVKELGVHNRADILLNYHAQLYPPDLVQKLALPRDPARSASLDLEEVHDALAALKGRRAFFDPDKDTLLDASVKGAPATGLYVSLLYMVPSGRTARGVIPYDLCPASQRAFDQALQDEASVGSLLSGLGSRRVHEAASADSADKAHEDALRQLERRVADSEAAQAQVTDELARLRDPQPWADFDEQNADVVRAKVEDGGAREFGRAGLERIRDYEERHKNRKGVLSAVEAALAAQRG